MMLLSYSGFLRYDEVSSLRFSDVKVQESHLVLNIQKSNIDQYRQSSEVLISKGCTVACPYSMYLRYVKLAGFEDKMLSDFYLFRPVYRSGTTCKLINKNKKLSYTLAFIHFDQVAQTAAANSDVSDKCLKKHGKWNSDASKDGYIVDSIEKRLKISKALGL